MRVLSESENLTYRLFFCIKFSFVTSALLLAFGSTVSAQTIINEDDAKRAAAWCAAKNLTGTIEQFVTCTAGSIAESEVKRCQKGRSCFGVNFKDIVRNGPCGGKNSAARGLFGADVCGDGCRGKRSVIRYINKTGRTIEPKVKGQCDSRENKSKLKHNHWIEWSDTGESHFWVWSGRVGKPKKSCRRDGTKPKHLTSVGSGKFGESPKTGKWKLKAGHIYEFRRIDGCTFPVDVTPRYRDELAQ